MKKNMLFALASITLGMPAPRGLSEIQPGDFPLGSDLPLTGEEVDKLQRLHGKYRELFLEELKAKYSPPKKLAPEV